MVEEQPQTGIKGNTEILIEMTNNICPKISMKFENLTQVGIAELITVVETMKLKLLAMYNKDSTFNFN